MAKKNWAISTVATAPSPATSGTSLVVATGHGARFADDEPAIVFPEGEQPDSTNAEIVMITNISTDTFTITRQQESTSARTIVVGDIIMQGFTAKDWNDLVTLIGTKITASSENTLTNKTIDGDTNTLQDIPFSAIKSTDKAGTGAKVPTTDDDGTHGEYLVKFNADGELEATAIHNTDVVTDGASIALTPAPASDHLATGMKISLTAHENVAFGDVCFINTSGKAQIIDADAIATMSGIVMAIASISADASGEFLLMGIARDDTWAWTVGGLIYGSVTGTTGNTLTQTAPSATDDVVQIMGVATHADRMLFNPQLVQIERV